LSNVLDINSRHKVSSAVSRSHTHTSWVWPHQIKALRLQSD